MLKKKIVLFIIVFDYLSFPAQAQPFTLSGSIDDLNASVTCLALSPDGEFLVAGDVAGQVIFRDAESGRMLSNIKAFDSSVECINFNSTGKLMIVATRDGEIKIYDLLRKKFIHALYSPEYSDMRFALFSIADGFIYFNGQGRLYKTRSDLSQVPVKIYAFDSTITHAAITDDRSALIFACGNSIQVLNTRTDRITQELKTTPASIEQFVLSSGKLITWNSDGIIAIRKYELNQLNSDHLLWFKAGKCGKFTFSHNGNTMVTGNIGTWARVWKPFERNIVQELFGHRDAVTNFAFSKDDQTLFTTGNDQTIKVWKQQSENEQKGKIFSDSSKIEISKPPNNTPDSRNLLYPGSTSTVTAMPLIELDHENIPAFVGGRNVDKTSVVEIDQMNIDIFVFDNSTLDGDVMSLSFHNQWILIHYEVTKKKRKISLELKPDSNNYLVLFADNLGKTPPNTAVISFSLHGQEKIFRLQSDLKSCSAINFIYKKK